MAITTLMLTGFEHGSSSALGSGLWSNFLTTTGVTFPAGRNGLCLQVASSASAPFGQIPSWAAGNKKVVVRLALRNTVRPSVNGVLVAAMQGPASAPSLTIDTDGTLKAGVSGGTFQSYGVLTLNQWYLVELQMDTSGTTYTVDWRVDGAGQTQASRAGQVATDMTTLSLGVVTSSTTTVQFDDVICGAWTTAASDWYGDGQVLAMLPGSDGTHSIAGSQFSFGDAGTAFSSTSTAYTMVDDAAPWTTTRSTTDNLAQRIVGANYLEIAPVAAPALAVKANAVRALLAYSSSGTTANTGGCVVRNSAGTSVTIFGFTGALADYSESSNFFKGAIASAPAAGWTPAEVSLIRWRCGYSDDISPVPTWQALMLEVDWPMAAASLVFPTRMARNTLLRR